ncbi:MAG: carbohydrate-binding protein [Gammaproteobacteria bacterium]|nr:MAG: carbohydrate-binding protein [Gammaproteobacteria bacterium]
MLTINKTFDALVGALKRTSPMLVAAMAIYSTSSSASCTYSVDNEWGNGFTASITIKNDTSSAISGWNVNWQYSTNRIAGGWNANISGTNPYSASNLSWNGNIAAGQSVSFGFQGEKNGGSAERPTISGTGCGATTSSASSVRSSVASSSLRPSSAAPSSVASSSVRSSIASSSVRSSSSVASSVANACPSQQSNAFQTYAPKIPVAVQAEDFDPAGYSDSSTTNEGGAYRTDTAVDIKSITGGNAVGWMTNGEWLEYTIYVETEGDYDVTIRSGAVGDGRTLKISQCSTTLIESFAVPNVSTWGEFKTWSAGKVHLAPGYQKIRVTVGSTDYLDLDWIYIGTYTGTIDPKSSSSSSTSSSSSSQSAVCDLKAPLKWVSSGPVISPKNSGWKSIKDPSIVKYNGVYHVYATYYDSSYKSMYTSFTDWSSAQSAQHISMNGTTVGNSVAPQVFYFRPHNKWYLITQWGGAYSTTDDISRPNWSAKKKLLQGEPTNALDFWNICDANYCYLYFSRDDGVLYMSKTTIANFPNFSGYTKVMEDHRGNGNQYLFEAPNVYKLDGQNKYLLMVEAYPSGPRMFRSWTSSSLDGPWTALADTDSNPFAGNNNVSWPGGKWADGISHGELIRSGYDERLTIDPCNLEFLYQGQAGTSSEYNTIPYKLGVLKLQR